MLLFVTNVVVVDVGEGSGVDFMIFSLFAICLCGANYDLCWFVD